MDDDAKPSNNTLLNEVMLVSLVIAILGGVAGIFFIGGVLDWYREILERLYAIWKAARRTVQIIVIMLSMGLIGFIITFFRRFYDLRDKLRKELLVADTGGSAHTVSLERETEAAWNNIRLLAGSGNPSDWNMAVLRADALLDDVLSHRGYQGATLADRLKVADPETLPSLDILWSAHRLRNAIAHDPLEQHTKDAIIHALRAYETALKELGALIEEAPVS